jgi:general stress protein CsbA
MKFAKIIAWLGLISMTAVLLHGFINGNFFSDGKTLLSNPWGLVSFIDLYVGFFLMALWILFREEKTYLKVLWVISLLVFGFLTGALYVLIHLYRSQDDFLTFFLGHQKDRLLNQKTKR